MMTQDLWPHFVMWLRMENPFFTLQIHLFLLLSFPRGATDFITGEKKTLWHLLHPHFSFFSSFFFSVFPSFFKNTTTIAAAAWSVDSTHTSSRSSRFNPHYSSSSSQDLSPSLLRRTLPALPLRFPFLRSFLREDETLKSNKPIISSTLLYFLRYKMHSRCWWRRSTKFHGNGKQMKP